MLSEINVKSHLFIKIFKKIANLHKNIKSVAFLLIKVNNAIMNKEQAIKYAGNANQLAKILGISRCAVSQWKDIPKARIWQLQILHPEWFLNT